MQPDEIKTPEPELIPEDPMPQKKKGSSLTTVGITAMAVVAFLMFALTPRSDGHGASRSSRSRAEQRQSEIARTLSSENQPTDDASGNQR